MKSYDIMQKDVIYVEEDCVIQEVISIFVKNNISGVPVVNKEHEVIGMVTKQDVITREKDVKFSSYISDLDSILFIDGIEGYSSYLKRIGVHKAKDIMSSPAYTVSEDATVAEIATIMLNRHINHVPVVDKNQKLVGIIGRKDLLPMLIK